MELVAAGLVSPRKRKRPENTITEKALQYFTKIDANFDSDWPSETETEGEIGSSTQKGSPSKKTHICKLCKNQCNGSKEWNLAVHLAHCHQDTYKYITEEKEPLIVTRLKTLQNCTEAVTVNGRPFEWIHDSGYRKQFQKTLDELAASNLALNLSDHNLTVVKQHLSATANTIRQKIKDEVKDQPLSLLVDLVTKHKRSILGVSLQYSLNGELKVRSIGFIQLSDRHTGKYLAEVIIKRLEEFDIKLIQIFTITTDNGKNVLKLVRDMASCLQNEVDASKQKSKENSQGNSKSQSNNASSINDNEIDSAITDLLMQYADIDTEEEEALERAMDEVPLDCHETLLEAMTDEMANYGADIVWNITGMNCVAHMLQLAVHEALKKLSVSHQNVIELCREMSKFLRLESTRTDMLQLNIEYRLPRLEVQTRWSSMYYMVNDFLFQLFQSNLIIFDFFIHQATRYSEL